MRVGIGYDVHRFTAGKPLVLGGVEIPYDMGLKGHSDADVLIHAICDALLGAAAMGDIGRYFPDTDDSIKGISSLLILKDVCGMLHEKGFGIVNIDTVVIAEKPKIGAHAEAMKKCLAEASGINENLIGIKATTTEGLGFEGRKEGISAQAVVLIDKLENLD
jgi:2-C-methyl-D-erythritol 2,4-cyclodiphosphate synthase